MMNANLYSNTNNNFTGLASIKSDRAQVFQTTSREENACVIKQQCIFL